MVTFEDVWARVMAHAGGEFETKTGRPFTYGVHGGAVRPSRTDYLLGRNEFVRALAHVPCDGPRDMSFVRGPSYIWAILHDRRIRRGDW